VAGKHITIDIITKQNLDVGYGWQILFKDIQNFCRGCDNSQKIG
jgi:hypothetical protein